MTKKDRLKEALRKFTGTDDKTLEAFKVFSQAVTQLQTDLKEKIQVATLDKVSAKLSDFQSKIDFTPILNAVGELETTLNEQQQATKSELEAKIATLTQELATVNQDELNEKSDEIANLQDQLTKLANRKIEIPDFGPQIKDSEQKLKTLIANVQTALENQDQVDDAMVKKQVKDLTDELEKVRKEMLNRIANIGGGSMNRAIYFNGVDRLTRYTDINYKAGSNVTFTIANNDQTKKVDVTISATGGGGGSVRLITSISVDTAAASATGTDYVYLCSGTMILTMPDATASNTNLYTVKNVGTGVVTIATTSAQTIDSNLTITMATQFTSVDLISDTANWAIT